MNLRDRNVVLTGAAGGIGRALIRLLAEQGARVAATDLDPEPGPRLMAGFGEPSFYEALDVCDDAAFTSFLSRARADLGSIDVCILNAGVAIGADPVSTSAELWDLALGVNLRQHGTAARELLPDWLEQGEGYLVVVASAAGLLTQIGSAPYAVSKHAAVAFAEWLSVTYGSRGLRVSCVCPMGVDTQMLEPGADGALGELGARVVRSAGEVLGPDVVARQILDGVSGEHFLVLPHGEVLSYFQRKGQDYDRWLAGMGKLQDSMVADQSIHLMHGDK